MNEPIDPQRARFLRRTARAVAALAASRAVGAQPAAAVSDPGPGRGSAGEATPAAMATRPIPSSGEALPVVGCGTWIGFDVGDDSREAELARVVEALFAAGGRVLDSSPMYGRSEAVTGRLLAARRPSGPAAASHHAPFVATKVWTSGQAAGIAQMEQSIALLGRVDLMQVHNLLDWKTHLPTLRRLKKEDRIRYVGVTHYTASAYRELEAVLRAESLDFVQVNYAIDEREAEDRILPLAADRGVAVLVNRPLGGGGLLKRLGSRPLPGWSAEIGAAAWPQVLLKFVLSHPAVTCAIPGTGNARHMVENAAAGVGAPPDHGFWRTRIADVVGG